MGRITLLGAGKAGASSTLLDGLIASFSLDNNTNDASGNVTTSFEQDMTYSLGAGKVNQGGIFVGSSYFKCGSLSDFSFIQNTLNFTISLWLKPTDYTNTPFYFMGNTNTSAEKGFFVGSDVSGKIIFAAVNGSGITILASANTFFTDNSYILVTIVGNGSTVNFYKNTTLFTSGAAAGSLSSGDSTKNLCIGFNNGLEPLFNGYMDIPTIWNRPLTTDEITEFYNSGNGKQYPFASVGFWLLTNAIWNNSGIWDNLATWIN